MQFMKFFSLSNPCQNCRPGRHVQGARLLQEPGLPADGGHAGGHDGQVRQGHGPPVGLWKG